MTGRRFDVRLRPSVARVSSDGEIGGERPISRSGLNVSVFEGPKARAIVRKSIEGLEGPGFLVRRVSGVTLSDGRPRTYVVRLTVDAEDPEAFVEALRDRYGASAEDTWMEGRIMVSPTDELHLALVRVDAS